MINLESVKTTYRRHRNGARHWRPDTQFLKEFSVTNAVFGQTSATLVSKRDFSQK